jgi:hypothetical protein
MTGGYLAHQVRQHAIRPVIAFREYVFRDVIPQFCNLNQRADQIGVEFYDRAITQPVDEDCDGDTSQFAEDAHDHALSWYEMMRSLRQTMLNLLAAGLFHLTEQQLASLGQNAGFEKRQPKSTKLQHVAEWYKSVLCLDLHTLKDWQLIEELRLVTNTAKHAEGDSSKKLKALRPDLFCDPALEKMFKGTGFSTWLVHRPVVAPLAGEDLFVTEGTLRQYAEGVESFFREIAAVLDEHQSEYY